MSDNTGVPDARDLYAAKVKTQLAMLEKMHSRVQEGDSSRVRTLAEAYALLEGTFTGGPTIKTS